MSVDAAAGCVLTLLKERLEAKVDARLEFPAALWAAERQGKRRQSRECSLARLDNGFHRSRSREGIHSKNQRCRHLRNNMAALRVVRRRCEGQRRSFSKGSDKTSKAEKRRMADIMSLYASRGFVYPGSEAYGGLSGCYDYGPLGSLLKHKIKNAWWNEFVVSRHDCVGVDTGIILHRGVWEAAGHASEFTDTVVKCRDCKESFRVDKLIEEAGGTPPPVADSDAIVQALAESSVKCPSCKAKSWSTPTPLNLLFGCTYGTSENAHSTFLRPETAQTTQPKLPFGIGQIGKAFRNEIHAQHSLFRTREFEQMELEYFCHPGDSLRVWEHWVSKCHSWLLALGLRQESLRITNFGPGDVAHYAQRTADIEFRYPFGWQELWGVAHRGDYDLTTHHKASPTKQDMRYIDPKATGQGQLSADRDTTNEKVLFPHVIEPSVGVDRLFLALLCDAYTREQLANGSMRTVLKLHPDLAPYRAAVLPLTDAPGLVSKAEELHGLLMTRQQSGGLCASREAVDLQTSRSIGRRYRRQDEIGTPFCLTVDNETLQDECVTVRHRDTMHQVRVSIKGLDLTVLHTLF